MRLLLRLSPLCLVTANAVRDEYSGCVQLRLLWDVFRSLAISVDDQPWVWYNRNSDLHTWHARWKATMASTDLLKKLKMQPGQRVLILNAPQDYLEVLAHCPKALSWRKSQRGIWTSCTYLPRTWRNWRNRCR